MDLEKLAAQARGILYAILVLGVVLVLSGIILAWSTLNAASALDLNWTMSVERATPGFVLGAIGLLISVLPCMLLPLTAALFRRAIDARYRFEQLMGSIENQRQLLESIRQTASLSDAAKQIAYRQKDLEALRAAIREDAEKGDFEAATMLANEMERRFGYSLEANKLRDHIQQTSKAAIDLRVRETIEHVELLLNRHDWTDAQRECDRLLRSFPNHTEARRLPSVAIPPTSAMWSAIRRSTPSSPPPARWSIPARRPNSPPRSRIRATRSTTSARCSASRPRSKHTVMAGLVPAIHAFWVMCNKDVDARPKAGHDDVDFFIRRSFA